MLKVLMTGASGLVGARVKELLKTDFTWLTPSSQELDITDKDKTLAFVQSHDFDCFLHLAAYTNVDQAEIEHDYCRKINVEGTANTFRAASSVHKPYILISTDFVFNFVASCFLCFFKQKVFQRYCGLRTQADSYFS